VWTVFVALAIIGGLAIGIFLYAKDLETRSNAEPWTRVGVVVSTTFIATGGLGSSLQPVCVLDTGETVMGQASPGQVIYRNPYGFHQRRAQ
jgi:hypothetical protein